MKKVIFQVDALQQDLLVHYLSALPFTAFEEPSPGILITGLNDAEWQDDYLMEIDKIKEYLSFSYRLETEPDQNWNAIWEASFREIVVDDFCRIRAPFHQSTAQVKYDILMEPRMAFGTGHHETTRLVIRSMATMPIAGGTVLDFGAGTGVLAILAHLMGADQVVAIEHDPVAFENLEENVEINHAGAIDCFLAGNLDGCTNGEVDVLLANITRNVIIEHLPSMFKTVKSHGLIVLSGILQMDEQKVHEVVIGLGGQQLQRFEENEWVALTYRT